MTKFLRMRAPGRGGARSGCAPGTPAPPPREKPAPVPMFTAVHPLPPGVEGRTRQYHIWRCITDRLWEPLSGLYTEPNWLGADTPRVSLSKLKFLVLSWKASLGFFHMHTGFNVNNTTHNQPLEPLLQGLVIRICISTRQPGGSWAHSSVKALVWRIITCFYSLLLETTPQVRWIIPVD